jgi:DNA-binding transcriptional LysR family regulator
MELRALRYFVEVVRRQSFTAAAEALFVTQSTVSKMILVLEQELGTALLVRDEGHRKRRLIPTDAGRLVLARAQEMLAGEAAIREGLQSLDELQSGELTIGIPRLGATLFAPAISAFHQQWPGIELKLVESGSHAIEAALRADELEIGFCLAPVADDLDFVPICDYPLRLLAPRNARWENRSQVSLAELASEPFLLYGETFMLNEVIDRACQQAGFKPTIACRSSQWDLIATLVECGMGIALLPEPNCVQADVRRFVTIPVVEPEMRWILVLTWRRAAYLSRAARAWIDSIHQHFDTAPAALPASAQ